MASPEMTPSRPAIAADVHAVFEAEGRAAIERDFNVRDRTLRDSPPKDWRARGRKTQDFDTILGHCVTSPPGPKIKAWAIKREIRHSSRVGEDHH